MVIAEVHQPPEDPKLPLTDLPAWLLKAYNRDDINVIPDDGNNLVTPPDHIEAVVVKTKKGKKPPPGGGKVVQLKLEDF